VLINSEISRKILYSLVIVVMMLVFFSFDFG